MKGRITENADWNSGTVIDTIFLSANTAVNAENLASIYLNFLQGFIKAFVLIPSIQQAGMKYIHEFSIGTLLF